MAKCTIFNMDCEDAMSRIEDGEIDFILTSPPYNTSRTNKNTGATLSNRQSNSGFYPYLRYDVAIDGMANEQYVDWQTRIFNVFNRILKKRMRCVQHILRIREYGMLHYDHIQHIEENAVHSR